MRLCCCSWYVRAHSLVYQCLFGGDTFSLKRLIENQIHIFLYLLDGYDIATFEFIMPIDWARYYLKLSCGYCVHASERASDRARERELCNWIGSSICYWISYGFIRIDEMRRISFFYVINEFINFVMPLFALRRIDKKFWDDEFKGNYRCYSDFLFIWLIYFQTNVFNSCLICWYDFQWKQNFIGSLVSFSRTHNP